MFVVVSHRLKKMISISMKNETRSYGGRDTILGLGQEEEIFEKSHLLNCVRDFFSIIF